MHSNDTICAVSTPPGVGGIAIIRVSGPMTFEYCDRYFSKNIEAQDANTIIFGEWREGKRVIDEVLISKFIGPASFTGEDVVEISVHGSRYIQAETLRTLIEAGCRSAGPGEFTQRAFLNNKMDLSQAEAVADLIATESLTAHRLAMQQMKGTFSSEINDLRQQLIDFASLIELELDFSEEDVEFADRDQFRTLINLILKRVNELSESFKLGNVLKNGVPVAIIGAPNSGKSTLLNALLKEQRAIVSDIPGTTRDAIEDTVNLGGVTFRFIDTAGLRVTEDIIENKGIDIAKKKAADASIILKIMDASQELMEAEGRLFGNYFDSVDWEDDERTVTIYNKIDQVQEQQIPDDVIGISALKETGLSNLKEKLIDMVDLGTRSSGDVIISNARHYEVLSKVGQALNDVNTGLDQGLSGDLMAIDIRKALHYLGELTGAITTEDLLGNIFSRFCIGK